MSSNLVGCTTVSRLYINGLVRWMRPPKHSSDQSVTHWSHSEEFSLWRTYEIETVGGRLRYGARGIGRARCRSLRSLPTEEMSASWSSHRARRRSPFHPCRYSFRGEIAKQAPGGRRRRDPKRRQKTLTTCYSLSSLRRPVRSPWRTKKPWSIASATKLASLLRWTNSIRRWPALSK